MRQFVINKMTVTSTAAVNLICLAYTPRCVTVDWKRLWTRRQMLAARWTHSNDIFPHCAAAAAATSCTSDVIHMTCPSDSFMDDTGASSSCIPQLCNQTPPISIHSLLTQAIKHSRLGLICNSKWRETIIAHYVKAYVIDKTEST